MYENYIELSVEERTAIKSYFKAIRAKANTRPGSLAWAFIRGLPYRRIERTTSTQVLPDGTKVHHNKPDARAITNLIALVIPGFALTHDSWWKTTPDPKVVAWLENEEGALPIPPPRVKVKPVSGL